MRRAEAVPVVVFAFNRPRQLLKTFSCLKKNQVPLLYVFADGPRNESDIASVERVRQIIDDINWTKVKKTYSSANKGLSQSIQTGLDQVFKDYDSAIVIEDDIAVAPDFYTYMASALEYYKDNEQIAAVTGLRYPFNSYALGDYDYDAFLTRRFSSWGWGTWKRFWQTVEFDSERLDKEIDIKKINTARAGEDMPQMIEQLLAGQVTGGWDINCAATMLNKNQFEVCPTKNRVVNTGLSEGTHAFGELPFWKLSWEIIGRPNSYSFPDRLEEDPKIAQAFLEFFHYHLNSAKLTDEKRSILKHRSPPLSDKLRSKLGFR